MKGRDRSTRSRRGARPPSAAAVPPAPAPPLAWTHPAFLAIVIAAAACLALNVTFRMDDPDLWEHLLVGRVIWQTHGVPMRQIWCWPTYGTPQVLPSWGFRALLWPFWAAGGVPGLFVWRWITTLAAFGIAWLAARRMGARGLLALVLLVVAGIPWRIRSQCRPEMLVAILLMLEVWILEMRRGGGRDRSWWIVAIAWVWANAHISYFFGLAVSGFYLLDDLWAVRRRPAPARSPRRLALVLAACCAVSFVNPFGWRAVVEPFEFFLHGRHELIYQTVREMAPIHLEGAGVWAVPILLGLGLLLLLWRWRRSGFDVAEASTLAMFATLAARNQRFLGLAALVSYPFLTRDLESWWSTRRVRAPSAAGVRAALAGAAMLAICLPGWRQPMTAFGVGLQPKFFPVGACDWMAAHGVEGNGFNPFYWGGYLLWRFWPDRGRLPFMDIHQTGTRRARDLMAMTESSSRAYRALQSEWRFDWALLDRRSPAGPVLLDFFATDTTRWAPVFLDDAAVLFVRRDGRLAALAGREAYHDWPPSWPGLDRIAARWNSDPVFRIALRQELQRQVRESPWSSLAHQFLGRLALMEADEAEASRQYQAALRVEPDFPGLHLQLAHIALRAGRLDEAQREFRAELRVSPTNAEARAGLAHPGSP